MSKDAAPSPQPALLGLLIPGPKHPYELHQEFDRELGRVWHIGQSHFYAVLKQLAESDLVTVEVEAQRKRPARNVYHLTPAGQEAFLRWLHTPIPRVRHIRLEFLTRLYFFRRLALPGLEQLIAEQTTVLRERLAAVESAMAESDDAYWRLVLAFRQNEIQAVMNWLDRCLNDIAE